MTREDDPLTAASAALGTTLTAPEDLGGSERSLVLRCRLPDGGSVVIKTYPDSDEGRQSFAAEAAGLALAGGAGAAPRLLAASPRALLIVMTDLGSGPSLADLLLGDDAAAASSRRVPDLAAYPAFRTRVDVST
jgi:predicted Ser/Thr protein kinase